MFLIRISFSFSLLQKLFAKVSKKTNFNSMTNQLHTAVETGQLEIVSNLIAQGVDVNLEDANRNTLLELAVRSQNVKILELLLKAQAKVNIINDFLNECTPLHIAVELQNESISKILLNAGADVNAENDYMDTPLHKAVKFKSFNISKLLLESGANVNAKNRSRKTPLHLAVQAAEVNILKLLLTSGADLEIEDSSDETALFMAVKLMNINLMEVLLEAGANLNIKNVCELTPLHLVIKQSDVNMDVLKFLLKSGADIHAKGICGFNAIHVLVDVGNVKILKMFLDLGADFNAKNNLGYTPLHMAVSSRILNFDILSLLINTGANVNEKTASGDDTVFSLLIKNKLSNYKKNGNFIECVKLLIESVDVNLTDSKSENLFNHILESKISKKSKTIEVLPEAILKHIAKLNKLNLKIDLNLSDFRSRSNIYSDFFKMCELELEDAKNSKPNNCWVSFLNLLVDDQIKFVKYAGNKDLIEDFKQKVKKFPIYGAEMQNNVRKGIEERKLFDEAADVLSYHCSIFSPTHLVIRDILDILNAEDWKKLNE